jgi:hypothetical protein
MNAVESPLGLSEEWVEDLNTRKHERMRIKDPFLQDRRRR